MSGTTQASPKGRLKAHVNPSLAEEDMFVPGRYAWLKNSALANYMEQQRSLPRR